MNYKQVSLKILKLLGASENISSVSHCATRLRVKVLEKNQVDFDKIKKIPEVLGVVENNDELQIIIGPGVESLYAEFINLNDSKNIKIRSSVDKPKLTFKKAFMDVTDFIAGAVLPSLPVIIAGGMISAVLVLGTLVFNLSPESGTYIVLNAIYTAAFTFLPIYVGYNVATRLRITPSLGALLGAVLVVSDINGVEGLSFLSIPISTVNYSNSIIPVIFGVLFMAVVFKPLDRVIPAEIKFFTLPLLTMIITVPVTLIVLGPMGTWVGDAIGLVLIWLNDKLGWLSVGVIGALTPFLLFSGTASGLYAPIFVAFAELGYENFIMPGMLAANLAVGGATIAVVTMLKNKEKKAISLSSGLTATFGITEPAIFGTLIKYKTPFLGATIGGLVGGLFAGFVHLKEFAFASPGVASIIAFINPDGTGTNLIMAILTMLLSFGSGFIITRLLGIKEEENSNE